METSGATPVRARFRQAGSYKFYEELGDLLNADNAKAQKVLELIDRVVRGPFEPSLVLDCEYLDEPNELFRYTLIDGLVVEWTVKPMVESGSVSKIYNENWRVNFLAIQRVTR